MEKKYKLTEETINVNGITLYRIEAVRGFANIKKGDKGGFIEKEENLSQNGDCWVYHNAVVYGNAEVYNDAKVFEDARIYGNARVFGKAVFYGDAKVFGNAMVYGDAKVYGKAVIYGNARVFGKAVFHGDAKVYGNAMIYDNAKVFEDTRVYDNAEVFGNAEIRGDAVITSKSDYIVFKNWWSSGRYFTWTKNNNMWKVGCFYGTGKELIEKAYKDSNESGKEYEKIVKYVESILKV